MNKLLAALGASAIAASLLGGCDRGTETAAPPPPPREVGAEDTGHYCGMLLADHEGPKGQIHLSSRSQPVWFSSVRDTVAFLRLPEEARDIRAVYVNDMALATKWEQPEPGTWVDARTAWFVIESSRLGGMGAPEAVPFSDRGAAEAFRQSHGGKLVRLDDIPDSYVLGPVDLPQAATAASRPASDPSHRGGASHEGGASHSSGASEAGGAAHSSAASHASGASHSSEASHEGGAGHSGPAEH